jgi:hypothetical protein
MIAVDAVNPLSYMLGVNPRFGDVQRYAAETGGPVIIGNGHQVSTKLAALIEELRGRYTMGYVPSVSRPEGTFCRFSLKLTPTALVAHSELRRRHYAVRIRRGTIVEPARSCRRLHLKYELVHIPVLFVPLQIQPFKAGAYFDWNNPIKRRA